MSSSRRAQTCLPAHYLVRPRPVAGLGGEKAARRAMGRADGQGCGRCPDQSAEDGQGLRIVRRGSSKKRPGSSGSTKRMRLTAADTVLRTRPCREQECS